MKTTENYGLKKPDYEDSADINVINENMDAIDAGLFAHASDEKLHVTQQDRELWNQGMMSTYLHKKTGKVHELTGQGNIIEFLATASIADGDTWTVNGQPVTAKLQNGELLSDELFKAGNWVTGVRLDGDKLGFRSGASSTPSIFGNGSDGDAVISGTVSLPVPVPHQSIVEKQYKSLTINPGAIFKCAAHNAGLIIRVKGDCIIHGTIDQSGKAPKTNYSNNYPYPSQLKCGRGGNGGKDSKGGQGMLARAYGGGWSGGGQGGDVGHKDSHCSGGAGGSVNNITISMSDESLFTKGYGSVGPGQGTGGSNGAGGGGGATGLNDYGGNGGYIDNGIYHGAENGGANKYSAGGGGGYGNYGGGVVLLYVGGKLIIDGRISCNGYSGGLGGFSNIKSGSCNYSGSGGGAGGGAIYILYKVSYTNSGTLSVNGGMSSKSDRVYAGEAGNIGSITIIQYTK